MRKGPTEKPRMKNVWISFTMHDLYAIYENYGNGRKTPTDKVKIEKKNTSLVYLPSHCL